MAIDSSSIYVRNSELMTSPVDDELVILNLANNSYIALDAIGRRIWDLLETPQSVEQLCEQLEQEFDAPSGQIARDVKTFLSDLHAEGMIVLTED